MNKETTMEERLNKKLNLRTEDGGLTYLYDGKDEIDISELEAFINEEISIAVQKEREKNGRKTILDIAPSGVTGGMYAITKKAVNDKNKFKVVAVDFEHDLVALDEFEDEEDWTWYRAEEIINLINKD